MSRSTTAHTVVLLLLASMVSPNVVIASRSRQAPDDTSLEKLSSNIQSLFDVSATPGLASPAQPHVMASDVAESMASQISMLAVASKPDQQIQADLHTTANMSNVMGLKTESNATLAAATAASQKVLKPVVTKVPQLNATNPEKAMKPMSMPSPKPNATIPNATIPEKEIEELPMEGFALGGDEPTVPKKGKDMANNASNTTRTNFTKEAASNASAPALASANATLRHAKVLQEEVLHLKEKIARDEQILATPATSTPPNNSVNATMPAKRAQEAVAKAVAAAPTVQPPTKVATTPTPQLAARARKAKPTPHDDLSAPSTESHTRKQPHSPPQRQRSRPQQQVRQTTHTQSIAPKTVRAPHHVKSGAAGLHATSRTSAGREWQHGASSVASTAHATSVHADDTQVAKERTTRAEADMDKVAGALARARAVAETKARSVERHTQRALAEERLLRRPAPALVRQDVHTELASQEAATSPIVDAEAEARSAASQEPIAPETASTGAVPAKEPSVQPSGFFLWIGGWMRSFTTWVANVVHFQAQPAQEARVMPLEQAEPSGTDEEAPEPPQGGAIARTARAALLDKGQELHIEDAFSDMEHADEEDEEEFKHEELAAIADAKMKQSPSGASAEEIADHRGAHVSNFFTSLEAEDASMNSALDHGGITDYEHVKDVQDAQVAHAADVQKHKEGTHFLLARQGTGSSVLLHDVWEGREAKDIDAEAEVRRNPDLQMLQVSDDPH